MLYRYFSFILIVALGAACSGSSENAANSEEEYVPVEVDTAALERKNESLPSPRRQTTGTIGNTTITIDWGSPGVRDRVIWGELVPFGEVWRAGANENTTIEFSAQATVMDSLLDAGKYGFFIIPSQNDSWVLIFNEKNDAWGHFEYSRSEDALRVEIEPQESANFQERLIYEVKPEGIRIAWERKEIFLPVKG